MKTKTYIFTETEIMTLHNALTEYYHFIKTCKPNSPIAIANKMNAQILKDQFKTDISKI